MHTILLYIDPGTGSMLFTILIGVLTTLFFFLQKLFIRLKYFIKGGKADRTEMNRATYLIFSDSKRYWNVFEPIADEFEKRKTPLLYWTASEDDPALKKPYSFVRCTFIGNLNQAFAKLNLMNAEICLSTTPGLDVYQWKRSANVKRYVHILHAANDAVIYRMFGLDHYDSVLLSGEYEIGQIRKLEELRHLPEKDLKVVGLTYLDAMAERRRAMKTTKDEFTVLLAPSWGASSILCRYGEKIIESLVQTGFKIVIRPHPQSRISDKKVLDSLMARFPESEKLSWNFDNDNFDILSRSDIMISDFSGVIFDYSLVFDRPVIFADTSFDRSPYDAAWLEEPLWTFEILPQIGIPLKEEDFPRLREIILKTTADENLSAEIEKARRETWQYQGESARRITDYLIEMHEKLSEEP
jgi:hypothetical protein